MYKDGTLPLSGAQLEVTGSSSEIRVLEQLEAENGEDGLDRKQKGNQDLYGANKGGAEFDSDWMQI